MRRKYLHAAVPVGLLAAGLAFAQDTGNPSLAAPTPGVPAPGTTGPAATLQSLDTDRDGSVSMQEATRNPSLSGQFLTLDKNGNGALEPAEFSRFEAAGTATPGTSGAAPGRPATIGPAGSTNGISTPGTMGAPANPSSPTSPTTTQNPNQAPPPSSTPRQ